MAISGPASYVPTMNEFIMHWTAVNTALPAGSPLILAGGATVTLLTTHRDALQSLGATIQSFLNDLELARGDLELQKTALSKRLGEFNRKVRGLLSHTKYVRALPEIPPASSAVAVFVEALDDMFTLWNKINVATIPGFDGPLTLLDGYQVSAFSTEAAALKTSAATWQNAGQDLKLVRESRNDLQDLVHPILRDYRQAVPGLFAPGHALVDSLPRLTPAPGSTPDAVTASGGWDPMQMQALLTWTASDDPDLSGYSIRFCSGPNYSTNDESVIGFVSAGEPREFGTAAGLATTGSTATFRIYVVLTTGNEKGSNTVSITRP